jgi:hypothetical protein
MSNFEKAEKDLLTAYGLDKSNYTILFYLGNVRDKLNKVEEAIENFTK